jgi:hypothetical protein
MTCVAPELFTALMIDRLLAAAEGKTSAIRNKSESKPG